MNEIARLGLAIDSSPVVAATTALDKFAAAAKPAAAGASAVEKAAKGVASGTGLARYEMINFSRQIQDVGVSLVSGQSPFMVLAQQGTQIADIFGSSKTATVGGAIKQVTSGIASFLTPMRLLAGGTALAGAAAYVAYDQWKTFALQLDDTAKSVGTTTSEMAKLQAAASFKGISGDDFSKGIVQFGRGVYDARQNAGGLLDVFRANNVQVGTFTGSLEKAADLIQRASSDQQRLVLLQQMGLPANMQWVRYMDQGAEGIRRAKEQTTGFGSAANDEMVQKAREFDEAWNKAWTNFGLQSRSAIVTASGWIDGLIEKGRKGLMAAGVDVGGNLLKNGLGTPLGGVNDDFYKAVGAKGRTDPNATKDPNAVKNAIAQESAYTAVLDKSRTPAQMLAEMQAKLRDAAKAKGANDERKQHRLSAAA